MQSLDASKLLGTMVNFGDSVGQRYQGVIVAAWVTGGMDLDSSVRVTVSCDDGRYQEVWLANCTRGAIARPARASERRDSER